jgi:hypothetical protein
MMGLLTAFVAGCAGTTERNLALQTSGRVGCPPEAINITNSKTGIAGRTWTATCNGKTFYYQQ